MRVSVCSEYATADLNPLYSLEALRDGLMFRKFPRSNRSRRFLALCSADVAGCSEKEFPEECRQPVHEARNDL
jgi:hypothetical protein